MKIKTKAALIALVGEEEAERIWNEGKNSAKAVGKPWALPKEAPDKREEVERLEFVMIWNWLSTNEIINAGKQHWSKYDKIAKEVKKWAHYYVNSKNKKVKTPVYIEFEWFLTSGMDIDNVTLNQKFIIDGIVSAKVIPDDNPRYLRERLLHEFRHNSLESSVRVSIKTIQNEGNDKEP